MEDGDSTEQSEDVDTAMEEADIVPVAPEKGASKGDISNLRESSGPPAAASIPEEDVAEQESAAIS